MESEYTDPVDALIGQRERAAVVRLGSFTERLERLRAEGPAPDPDDIMPGEFERPGRS